MSTQQQTSVVFSCVGVHRIIRLSATGGTPLYRLCSAFMLKGIEQLPEDIARASNFQQFLAAVVRATADILSTCLSP